MHQTGMQERQLCKAATVQWQCAPADDPAVCLVSLSLEAFIQAADWWSGCVSAN